MCDAPGRAELAFLSHAGVRTRARRILATRQTVALAGLDRRPVATIVPPEGRPFAFGDLTLTLLPSGYLPGASHMLVEKPGGSRTLFVSRMASGEAGPDVRCTSLVLEPRLSDPASAGRPTGGDTALGRWLRGVISSGSVPVVLASIPSMLSRLVPILAREGLGIAGTSSVAESARRHRRAGHPLAPVSRYRGEVDGGTVLVAAIPRQAAAAPSLPGRARVAVVADAGDVPDSVPGVDVEATHALSHAAGLDAYARLVVRCGAGEVHLGRGLEALPAAVDRRCGATVRWIGAGEQVELV